MPKPRPKLGISVPEEQRKPYQLSESGTFREADFAINKTGLVGTPDTGGYDSARGSGPSGSSPGFNSALHFKGGLSLEDLEIVGTLGRGAGGVVEKAKHKPSGKLVALKHLNLFEDDEKHKEIINEVRTLHSSTNPQIVTFYDAFYRDGTVLMALEYMAYGSLADLLKKAGALPEEIVGKIALQCVSGLKFLHRELHVVHRDLKPANILIDADGNAKLADFGINRQLSNTMAAAQTFIGTSTYMSPERIEGGSYSFPSDIWALGLTILELATGEYPYPVPDTYFEHLSNVIGGDAPRADAMMFSEEFCDFIEVTLEKDPFKRQTADQLLEHPFLVKAKKAKTDVAKFIKKKAGSTSFEV